MRKELLVYIPSIEKNEELTVSSIALNRDYVLFNTPIGKFTANRKQLIEALQAIQEFDAENNSNVAKPEEKAFNEFEVDYGE